MSPELDLPTMMVQKQASVDALGHGIDGWAGLAGPGNVQVRKPDGSDIQLTTRPVVIATGSVPTPLAGVTIDQVRIVDSTGTLTLREVPKKLLVIGAGSIGLELGSVWRRLGAEVEVVEFLDHLTAGRFARRASANRSRREPPSLAGFLARKAAATHSNYREAAWNDRHGRRAEIAPTRRCERSGITVTRASKSARRWSMALPDVKRRVRNSSNTATRIGRGPPAGVTRRRATWPTLVFGLRLWASVSLALYAAFWLQLDNPFWAGASAAIVCQPQLGASLRKGWFRMLGTLAGAIMSVVLVACFAQDRILFLAGLALWGAACSLVAVLLRNFASYAASLAGYTAAIIAGDLLGTVGGVDANAAFLLAVTRATEICLGIVCAGVVLAATDLGGARRRLASLFAELAAGITAGLTRTLAMPTSEFSDRQVVRRQFLRRLIAFDPIIDQALGESSEIRYHLPVLQRAVDGLLSALAAWDVAADHLATLPHIEAQQEASTILESVPSALRSPPEQAAMPGWLAVPSMLHRMWQTAAVPMDDSSGKYSLAAASR